MPQPVQRPRQHTLPPYLLSRFALLTTLRRIHEKQKRFENYKSYNVNNKTTMETGYNEWPRHWQSLFATITRFRYIEGLFHIFYLVLLLG